MIFPYIPALSYTCISLAVPIACPNSLILGHFGA